MNWKYSFSVVVGVVGLALVIIGIQGRKPEVSGIPGTGTLSGEVEAPRAFKAARVYARNIDRNVLYMVYTADGRYQAVNLVPGNYEVSVRKRGYTEDVKNIVVTAGANATADFTLQEADVTAIQGVLYQGPHDPDPMRRKEVVELASYDDLYPPGPGRVLAERTCIYCHGRNFLPRHQWSDTAWNAAIDMMSNPAGFGRRAGTGPLIPPDTLSPTEREELVAYLAENFGPDSVKRGLSVAADWPLDEQALAKAMYVEFYLPLDPELDANNTQRLATEPHFDDDGNVWYADMGVPARVGKLDPRTGVFKDYLIPDDPNAHVHGLDIDSDGHVWMSGRSYLRRLDPDTGEFVRYVTYTEESPMEGPGHTPGLDSNENVWFPIFSGNKVGKWDRQTEEVTVWDVPNPRSLPYGSVVDADDNFWITEHRACKVAKFDAVTEEFTEYSSPSSPCIIRRVAADSRGTIWYSVFNAGKLGKLDPHTAEIIEYDIPMPFSAPYEVWSDGEDNVWISDAGQGGALIKFDQLTENFTYYPTPQRTDIPKVEITRDGAIWYNPRSSANSAVGVLYPDVTKMTTMAAYY